MPEAKIKEISNINLPNPRGKMVKVVAGSKVELLPYNQNAPNGGGRTSLNRETRNLLLSQIRAPGPYTVTRILFTRGRNTICIKVRGREKTLVSTNFRVVE